MESAIAAQNCGADRVELCARLDLDGLTPSNELILKTREAIDIWLHVIIRPSQGDFTVTNQELGQMIDSIAFCSENGIDGVVFGVLNDDGSMNQIATQKLIEAAGPMSITFHRAFDVCKEPKRLCRQLRELGIARILTSGQAHEAIDGIDLISELVQREPDIKIMAGSGVNESNVLQFWNAGVRQFHFTSHRENELGMNEFDWEKTRMVIKKLKDVCGF